MRSTGYVRRLDELGRVVLPSKVRASLSMDSKDEVEMYLDGMDIVLKKYVPACSFCGETENVKQFKEKTICTACIAQLSKEH